MPIPRGTRLLVSPSSETVLLEQDLEYAMAARLTGVVDDGSSAQVPAALPERTLSINPDATARALVLLVGLTLLLAGLTRLLNITGARRLVGWIVAFGTALALFGIIQYAVLGDHAFGGMRIYGFWTADEPAHDAVRAVRQQEPLRRLDVDGPAAGDGARPRVGRARAATRESGLAPRPALALVARGRKTATGGAGHHGHGRLAPDDPIAFRDCRFRPLDDDRRGRRRQALRHRTIPLAGGGRAGADAGWRLHMGRRRCHRPLRFGLGRDFGGSSGATALP